MLYEWEMSPPSRGAWIEISSGLMPESPRSLSPPSRGAWIEIFPISDYQLPSAVAPLAGGVD